MVGFQRARIALFLREYKSTPTCFWMDSGMSFSGGTVVVQWQWQCHREIPSSGLV